MTEGPEDLKRKVRAWLADLKLPISEVVDPRTNWSYQVQYPSGTAHRMTVLNPKEQPRSVVTVSSAALVGEQIKAYLDLDDDAKLEFLWELRRALNRDFTEFFIDGAGSGLECPNRFEVLATMWDDGLSLDSFARTLSSVYKAELAGVMVIQQRLSGQPFGPGGRFDFRRLGP